MYMNILYICVFILTAQVHHGQILFFFSIVIIYIGWICERNISYKGVETSPYLFKTVSSTTIHNGQKNGKYLVVVSLSCYKWYQSQTPGGKYLVVVGLSCYKWY